MSHEPKPGSFEDYLWNYEVDMLGAEGLASPETKAWLRKEWTKSNSVANRAAGAAKAVKTKANNAKAGISQKGLTGSTRQKQWAATIRGTMIGSFSTENQSYFAENSTAATFWIENRSSNGADLSARMDRIYADLAAAIKARNVYASEHETADGSLRVTPEYDALRNAVTKANNRWQSFLVGGK